MPPSASNSNTSDAVYNVILNTSYKFIKLDGYEISDWIRPTVSTANKSSRACRCHRSTNLALANYYTSFRYQKYASCFTRAAVTEGTEWKTSRFRTGNGAQTVSCLKVTKYLHQIDENCRKSNLVINKKYFVHFILIMWQQFMWHYNECQTDGIRTAVGADGWQWHWTVVCWHIHKR